MKMRRPRSTGLLLLALALAGCATPRQVSNEIVKTNLAQELAENHLLLLNIARAERRAPMHFTQVSAVHLPVGFGNSGLNVAVPFGGAAMSNYTATGNVAVLQSVDVVALNTQEFMRGITAPMPVETMVYYLDQGWDRKLIYSVFVRTIEIATDADNYTGRERYDNYPDEPAQFLAFQQLLDELTRCRIISEQEETKFGPAVPIAAARQIKALAAARAASMGFAASAGEGQAQLVLAPRTNLKFTDRPQVVALATHPASGASSADRAPARCDERFKGKPVKQKRTGADAGPGIFLTLRSPEAMLYYLGELARSQIVWETGEQPPDDTVERRTFRPSAVPRMAKLFELTSLAGRTCALSLNYGDRFYCVPERSAGLHVLSLMNQIVALQNKGADLPTTATVRLLR